MNIRELVQRNRRDGNVGLPCFCTASPFVIDAALSYVARSGNSIVIEATCNQVNQFGGYTGMRPADFAARVRARANAIGVDESKLILGGDHLGPEPWKNKSADDAMALSKVLVREFVEAGFCKIHLDASMACAGEPALSAKTVAERTAVLCQVAEQYAPNPELLFYIIGTEVPVPGGETTDMGHVVPTTSDSVQETINAHRVAFADAGLASAWQRIVSIVVQPGADFSHNAVLPYERHNAHALSSKILSYEGLTFEAHSTDYQPDQALSNLVKDHFVFLKVGPELTFAQREAVLALVSIENTLSVENPSRLMQVIAATMKEHPEDWNKHYSGDPNELALLKLYSFSDRIRYYWDRPEVSAALAKLISNLSKSPIPLALVSQYFGLPLGSEMPLDPTTLIERRIQHTIARYYRACGLVPTQ